MGKRTTEIAKKYAKANTTRFTLIMNRKTDKDVIDRLGNLDESKRGYILRLIREDIHRYIREEDENV